MTSGRRSSAPNATGTERRARPIASTTTSSSTFPVRAARRHSLLVGYPTIEETRAAAEAGNPKALKALESVERVEEFWRTFEAKKLRASDQLPELEGDALEFVWDCVGDDSRPDTEIRLGDRIIWTEPALWEGKARLKEVEALLAQRYGSRFRSLTPTEQSWLWLLGD